MTKVLRLLLLSAVSFSTVSHAQDLQNANHIFNAIHSSMRQWGSSLHHNGMSFFVASVPAGTQLYHGRSDNNTVKGMEWLAFEPEHAQFFAHPRGCGGRPPGPPGGKPPSGPGGGPPGDRSPPPADDKHRRPRGRKQSPLGAGDPEVHSLKSKDPSDCYGWLYTYNTKRDLQFLYVDGLSAGKSDRGTLDAEDYVLLNRTDYPDGFGERERAQGLCKKLRDEWGTKLSGVIRMEAGFEIIMCSFEDTVNEVYRTKVLGGGDPMSPSGGEHFTFMKAIASRYQGIGMNRVTLDYDRIATAYKHIEVPLANEEHRLVNASELVLEKIWRDVYDTIFDETPHRFSGVNWQVVADMLVARWSDFLQSVLETDVSKTQKDLTANLGFMLRPFIDGADRNATEEAHRCSRQFLSVAIPYSSLSGEHTSSLAQQAVTGISLKICKTLVDTHIDTKSSLEQRVGAIEELVEYLQWTSFKQCRGCAIDEVCMTAIWPFGTEEDHYKPSCKNATGGAEDRNHSYWRGPGHGGAGGGPTRIEQALGGLNEEL